VAKAEPKPQPKPVQVAKAEPKPQPKPVQVAKAEPKPEPKPVQVAKAEPKPEPKPVQVAQAARVTEPEAKPIQVASAKPARAPRVAQSNRRSETPRANGGDRERVRVTVKRNANSRLPQPTDDELVAIAAAVRNQALNRIARADGFNPGGANVRSEQVQPGT
jgi:hypothetical protein